MKSEPIVAALLAGGVELSVQDGRLILDAPQNLPDELLTSLRRCRDELIEAWAERAAVREFDGGQSRTAAERLAWLDLRTWQPTIVYSLSAAARVAPEKLSSPSACRSTFQGDCGV